jgi:hypothetical protein
MSAMDEKALYCLRRAPPEDFKRTLRASLLRQSTQAAAGPPRLMRFAAVGVACFALAGLFSVPSVRAGAAAFLDMFRVVRFAAVPVESRALQRLGDSGLDLRGLLSDQVQVVETAGPPTSYATPAAAGAAAGFHVELPAWMPVGWSAEAPAAWVTGPSSTRVTASTARLAQLLASLNINDVAVPQSIDGRTATIRTSPAVRVVWRHDGRSVELVESPSPQVDFPSGMDLPALAEIGLRIMGLSRSDAYRFAQSIDWRSTLVVPIPAKVASFRQVTVQGGSGLLLEGTRASGGGQQGKAGASVLWSDGSRVFALSGGLGPEQLLEMAQTLQ